MFTIGHHYRSGFLAVVDGVEIALTGLFAAVLAVIVTLGKNETCDSFEKFYKDAFTERLVTADDVLESFNALLLVRVVLRFISQLATIMSSKSTKPY